MDFDFGRFGSVLLLALAFFLAILSAATETLELTPQRTFSALLPSGENKILVLEQCVMCHGAELLHKRLEGRRGWSFEDWEEMVFDMIEGWNAEIERREIRPLAQYLTRLFGPESRSSGEPLADFLPPGEARELVLSACVSCHDQAATRARLASRAGSDESVWRMILLRMQRYAPSLAEEEIPAVARYLSDQLGRLEIAEASEMDAFYAFLAEGAGKDLVAANCLSCHGPLDLRRRLEQNVSDDYYWERSVRRMIKQWEAPLDPEVAQTIIEYLNTHYYRAP